MEACRPDFLRFCAFRVDDMQDREQILKCMSNHESQLQPLCGEFVANATQKINKFHTACDSDVSTLCKVTTLGPELRKCVVANLASLSKTCLATISELLSDMESHFPHGDWDDFSPEDFAGKGKGEGWPGHHRPHMFGAMMGASVCGGLIVVLILGLCKMVKRAACSHRRRGMCGCKWGQGQGQDFRAPLWPAVHVAQPVTQGEDPAGAGPAGAAWPPPPPPASGANGYRQF